MNPVVRLRHQRAAQQEADRNKALLRRIAVQIEFAKAIAPDHACIAQAEAILAGEVTDLAAAVAQAEAALAPLAAEAKSFTVHCVGHGHIDMNWMWSWPETVATTFDTFASVLHLMKEFPTLTYSQSQASVYALTELYQPAMFEEIKQRVAEGRWEVTAAHWVEGDKNLACGEALARHLLYSRRYFQEKFGLSPADVPVDWEPDTFGHANTIPSILAQGGVKFYYSCRTGGGHEHIRVGEERPPLFWWQAPNGARVLVNRETTWYNSYVNIGENIALPAVEFFKKTGLRDWLNVFGIGNHGGGPTRAEVEWFLELATYPVYPNVVFGTAKKWYEIAEANLPADLPVIDHELNYEFTGCYTSQSAIKKANRDGENFCIEAEAAALIEESLGGRAVPQDQLREAWLKVLFNQFHDILPGSGVAATRHHALANFQDTAAITGSVKKSLAAYLTSRVDTLSLLPDTPEANAEKAKLVNRPFEAGAGIGSGNDGYSPSTGGGTRFRPYVIYNPAPTARTEMVQIDVYDSDLQADTVVAIDAKGQAWPTQHLGEAHDWGHMKKQFLVPVELPALGYTTVVLTEGVPTVDAPGVKVEMSEDPISGRAIPAVITPTLKLQLNRTEGGLTSLTDLRNEHEITDGVAQWEFINENPRGMTAWVLGETGRYDGPTTLDTGHFGLYGIWHDQGANLPGGRALAVIADNAMEVPGTKSTVRTKALMNGLAPRVDFVADVDWREIGDDQRGVPGLGVWFPTGLNGLKRCETPYGSVTKDTSHDEDVPTLRYVHYAGEDRAVSIFQDGRYGFTLLDEDLMLRAVRSSFDPDHAPEVGKFTLRYSLYLHDHEPSLAEVTRLAAEFNHPPIIMPATLQSGDLPVQRSFASVEGQVVLSCIKKAEDGGVVVRLYEVDGQDAAARVTLDPAVLGGATQAVVVDLLEAPTGETLPLEGGVVSLTVPAFSTVSFILR